MTVLRKLYVRQPRRYTGLQRIYVYDTRVVVSCFVVFSLRMSFEDNRQEAKSYNPAKINRGQKWDQLIVLPYCFAAGDLFFELKKTLDIDNKKLVSAI